VVQIVARAHRQPQKKSVKAIHLLADGSSDVLLNSIALRKREMFDAFVSKERGRGNVFSYTSNMYIYSCVAELADLLSGKVVCREGEDIGLDPNVDENGNIDDSKVSKKRSSKKSKKTEVTTATTAVVVPDATMAAPNNESSKSAMLSTDDNMLGDADLLTMDEASTRMETSSDGGMSFPSDGGMSLPSDGEILGVSSDGMLIYPYAHILPTMLFSRTLVLVSNVEREMHERREYTFSLISSFTQEYLS
jgi:hypothetical protein